MGGERYISNLSPLVYKLATKELYLAVGQDNENKHMQLT
jgi:hypothetical protein